jgi:hypothetical protein
MDHAVIGPVLAKHKAISDGLGIAISVIQRAEWRCERDRRARELLTDRADSIEGLWWIGELTCDARNAGLGRTGTVASLILMHYGISARDAIQAVRAVRPGSIETVGQEHYLSARKLTLKV